MLRHLYAASTPHKNPATVCQTSGNDGQAEHRLLYSSNSQNEVQRELHDPGFPGTVTEITAAACPP